MRQRDAMENGMTTVSSNKKRSSGPRATIEIPMAELKDRNGNPYYVSVDPEVDLTVNLLDWVVKIFPNRKEDGRSFPRMFLTPRKLDDDGNPINPVPGWKREQQEVDHENGVDIPEASRS